MAHGLHDRRLPAIGFSFNANRVVSVTRPPCYGQVIEFVVSMWNARTRQGRVSTARLHTLTYDNCIYSFVGACGASVTSPYPKGCCIEKKIPIFLFGIESKRLDTIYI